MKVSANFYLQEFIDPDTYKRFGASSIWFIDRKIINLAQFIRERLGKPCMDLKVKGVTPDEVREELINNFEIYKRLGLGAIEDGAYAPTWCHIDVRETEELLIVKP